MYHYFLYGQTQDLWMKLFGGNFEDGFVTGMYVQAFNHWLTGVGQLLHKGKALFKQNSRLDSDFENALVDHYFDGGGDPYYMAQEQWNNIQSGRIPRDNSYYDQGLGSFDSGAEVLDRYDFSPLWKDRSYGGGAWQNIRNEAPNIGGAVVGAINGGQGFDILPPFTNFPKF
ncbi:MAG: hypothetical protein GY694_08225 [Gammaproteobacteria bacterium]|nr:hypothetical protein [Gammaproteobacteria bacterium]